MPSAIVAVALLLTIGMVLGDIPPWHVYLRLIRMIWRLIQPVSDPYWPEIEE